MNATQPIQDSKSAAAGPEREAVAGAVVTDLFGKPMPESESEENARDRKRNAAIQKLMRQVEQRVKEIRLWTMLGVTCDDESDKRIAIDRIGTRSDELKTLVRTVGATV